MIAIFLLRIKVVYYNSGHLIFNPARNLTVLAIKIIFQIYRGFLIRQAAIRLGAEIMLKYPINNYCM